MNLFDGIFPGEDGVANNLLNLFGSPTEINIYNKDYNPENGEENIATDTYDVISSPPLEYSIKDYDSENILRGDLYCFINADTLRKSISVVDFVSIKNAKIEINDMCFDVVSVIAIYSGAKIAAYKLQLRT